MRPILRATLAAVALAAIGAAERPGFAQPASSTGAAAAALTRIDAVVTDKAGRPVRDLKPEDFSIVEDGAAERVESATFVSTDGAGDAATFVPVLSRSDEQAEAARPGTRLFAIFLDAYHVDKGDASERAREFVTQFLEHDLGPRDLAIVVKPLDSLFDLRLTRDRAALAGAVSAFEGRKGDYAPKNSFEANYFAAAPERAEALRSQVVTSAINALAAHLGSLQQGRKTIIVVSEGFTRPPRRRDEVLPTIDAVTRTANRTGVSVYAVDPRALAGTAPAPAADGAHDERDVLKALASGTDGAAVLAAADLPAALPRLTADASGYYLLAFHPAHAADARTFHTVDVRVKRANVHVHARPGYWSSSADDLMRARSDRRVSLTTAIGRPQPMRHASPLIRPWFGVERGGQDQMQVSFVWEPVPPVPGDRVRTGPPAIAVVKASRVSDGVLIFQGTVRPTSAADDTDAAPAELKFSTAPGRLMVETAIEDADANVLDTDIRDVIVGALSGKVEVGTPQVIRAENARAFRDLENDASAVPVATRDFRRNDHLIVRLPVYADGPATVTASLSFRPGALMRQLAVTQEANGVYQTDVPLAGFVTGNYVVTLKAVASNGNATESVPFTIVP